MPDFKIVSYVIGIISPLGALTMGLSIGPDVYYHVHPLMVIIFQKVLIYSNFVTAVSCPS